MCAENIGFNRSEGEQTRRVRLRDLYLKYHNAVVRVAVENSAGESGIVAAARLHRRVVGRHMGRGGTGRSRNSRSAGGRQVAPAIVDIERRTRRCRFGASKLPIREAARARGTALDVERRRRQIDRERNAPLARAGQSAHSSFRCFDTVDLRFKLLWKWYKLVRRICRSGKDLQESLT
jgi:hypothetical protein